MEDNMKKAVTITPELKDLIETLDQKNYKLTDYKIRQNVKNSGLEIKLKFLAS